jgi:hypothetical protein
MKNFLPFLAGTLAVANVAFGQTEEKKTLTANEARVAKEAKAIVTINKKKPKRSNLNDHYLGGGLGYVSSFSSDAPNKAGININVVGGYSILKHKWLLELQGDLDVRFSANRGWYARAYEVPAEQQSDVLLGTSLDYTVGFYRVLVNDKKLAVTAGPFAGLAHVQWASTKGAGMMMADDGSATTYCFGLKAGLYLGEFVALSAQYTVFGIREIATAYPAYPVSFNLLRLGVTFKRPLWFLGY